ncbi:MAG: class B sortase [Lachnospiraceae bacterium]|nr:class B sortase [Lachnospiraceae bacterium]
MKRKIRIIILISCVAICLFSAYKLISIQMNYKKGEKLYEDIKQQVVMTKTPTEAEAVTVTPDDSEETKDRQTALDISVDFDVLKKTNPDIFGWLYLPYGSISYPLLQGEDNDTYLHQAYDKTPNNFGSIFIDYRNNNNLLDKHTIIYGHNMKNGSMFGTLKQFCDEKFYQKNKYFFILTPKVIYTYKVFSYHVADAKGRVYDVFYKDDGEYKEFIDLAKQSSYLDTGVKVSTENRTITLSTCTSSDDKRFVVHAKLAEEYKK